MAYDTPVLERRTSEAQRDWSSYLNYNRAGYEAEDAHNSRIRENYARLINPANGLEDVFERKAEVNAEVNTEVMAEEIPAVKPAPKQEVAHTPYLVRNARADSEIFRADNPINKWATETPTQITISDIAGDNEEEEENEDLRPTKTTIQYRTVDRARKEDDDSSEKNAKKFALTRNQKIAIIVAAALVVALIVLIIVNSTIIANLNADISDLAYNIAQTKEKIQSVKSEMLTLRGAYAGISDSVFNSVEAIINY